MNASYEVSRPCRMLGKHLDDPARRAEVVVAGNDVGGENAIGDLEDRAQPVGRHLVGPEEAEPIGVGAHDIA